MDCFLKQDGNYTTDQLVIGIESYFEKLKEETILETQPIILCIPDIENVLRICEEFKKQRDLLADLKYKIKKGENMKAEAIKNLTEVMDKEKNPHLQVVGQFLIEHLEQYPSDAKKILSEGKSLVKSIEAMRQAAEKKKVGNYAVLSDQEGFDIVLKYYGIDNKANFNVDKTTTNPQLAVVPELPVKKPKKNEEVLFDVKLEDFL